MFFSRAFESLLPLHRQHSAAIGFTKYYQPIGVTVHSHCVESFEGLLQRCRRGRDCSELWKKHNFSWTPYRWKTLPLFQATAPPKSFISELSQRVRPSSVWHASASIPGLDLIAMIAIILKLEYNEHFCGFDPGWAIYRVAGSLAAYIIRAFCHPPKGVFSRCRLSFALLATEELSSEGGKLINANVRRGKFIGTKFF